MWIRAAGTRSVNGEATVGSDRRRLMRGTLLMAILDILLNAAPAGGHTVGRGEKNLDNKLKADPNLVARNTVPEVKRPPRIGQCRNPSAQLSEAGRVISQQQQGKQRLVSASVISQQSTGVISQQQQGKHQAVTASVISRRDMQVVLTQMTGDLGIVVQ